MPAVNLGLLTPRAQRNPYVVPVEYPGILYDYSMGPARPYRPLDSILDPIGQAASEIFGEGSRVVVGSGSNIDHHGDGEALPRHGSNRHETGTAADFTVYRPDGSVVDPMSDDGRAYALRAAELGILGVGFGPEYMGNAYHMDLVEPGAGQGHVWASGASSMGDQLIAAMQGNTGVPGGVVASAAGRPASAPVSGQGASSMGRGGQQQEQQPFGQRLRDNFRSGGSGWDTLAVGLNGMTLRPDPGLQGLAGGRIADRREAEREERRLNQTAEWLRSIGRDDLAAAVLARGVDPNAAGGIALAPPEDRRSPQQRQYDEMIALGVPGQEALAAAYGVGGGLDPTADIQNYQFYVDQENENGRTPLSFHEWRIEARRAGATSIVNNTGSDGTDYGDPDNGNVWARNPDGSVMTEEYTLPNGQTAMRPVQIPSAGSEADIEAQAAADRAALSDEIASTSGRVVIDAALAAIEADEQRVLTGRTGAAAGAINPASANAELQRQVAVLRSNATIESLNQMRAASPTGGALGNVTEREGQMLADRAGALDPQSPNFRRDLIRYTLTLLQVIHGQDEGLRIFRENFTEGSNIPETGPTDPNDPLGLR